MLSSRLVDVAETRGFTFHNHPLDSSHSPVMGHLLTFPSLLGDAKTPSYSVCSVKEPGQSHEDTELPLAPLVPPGSYTAGALMWPHHHYYIKIHIQRIQGTVLENSRAYLIRF